MSSVEFGNASPALLQLLMQNVSSINTKLFYIFVPNMYLLKRFILSLAREEHLKTGTKGFLCRAHGCVNITLWLLSSIINQANVQKGLKTCSVKNILYIQVKLELSEKLAVAPMQRFHEIKRPSSKDTKQENLKILNRNKF